MANQFNVNNANNFVLSNAKIMDIVHCAMVNCCVGYADRHTNEHWPRPKAKSQVAPTRASHEKRNVNQASTRGKLNFLSAHKLKLIFYYISEAKNVKAKARAITMAKRSADTARRYRPPKNQK